MRGMVDSASRTWTSADWKQGVTERETFENTLLGLLYGGPAHGYELGSHFAAGGDLQAVGRLAKSQLYALLKTLETSGYALGRRESPGAAPTRVVYEITASGRDRFLGWVRRPADSVRGLRVEFLLKVYFLGRLGLSGQAELMDAQAGVLKARLKALGESAPGGSGIDPWVRALQEGLLMAGIEWLSAWRSKTPKSGGTGNTVTPAREPNVFPARVIDAVTGGGLARVDLNVEGGPAVVVLPAETWRKMEAFPGGEVEVRIPPAGAVLVKTGSGAGGGER